MLCVSGRGKWEGGWGKERVVGEGEGVEGGGGWVLDNVAASFFFVAFFFFGGGGGVKF